MVQMCMLKGRGLSLGCSSPLLHLNGSFRLGRMGEAGRFFKNAVSSCAVSLCGDSPRALCQFKSSSPQTAPPTPVIFGSCLPSSFRGTWEEVFSFLSHPVSLLASCERRTWGNRSLPGQNRPPAHLARRWRRAHGWRWADMAML